MHVFAYEHLCATASADTPSSLLAEGQAMLAAILEDLSRCPDVRVSTLLTTHQLDRLPCPAEVVKHASPSDSLEASFRRLARTADWSLLIAPESDDCLAERCRWVEQEGGRLLGPSSAAVRQTADKMALADHFHRHAIPSPPCWPVGERTDALFPLVCKPRDGAGSQATFLVHSAKELADALAQASHEGWRGRLTLQPYVPGRPVSVSFLAGPATLLPLPAADQQLSADGRFHYQGGAVPLPAPLDERARQLAERAVRVVPGLFGTFGVDLVLGPARDGSTDQVIEINPRLTTSYVGLRRLARFNLAEALLAVACGESLPPLRWYQTPITFDPLLR